MAKYVDPNNVTIDIRFRDGKRLKLFKSKGQSVTITKSGWVSVRLSSYRVLYYPPAEIRAIDCANVLDGDVEDISDV